ncbi:hypothetical protein Hdeb2414_s0005g00161111 [Helianthus debilis subsp. tardiflorus]
MFFGGLVFSILAWGEGWGWHFWCVHIGSRGSHNKRWFSHDLLPIYIYIYRERERESKLLFCSLWFGHFNGFAPNL